MQTSRPPEELRRLAAMLVDAEPDLQRQGVLLLESAPDLAAAPLASALRRALQGRVIDEQMVMRETSVPGVLLGAADCTAFAYRWLWSWQLCASHALPWVQARITLPAQARRPVRTAWRWRLRLEGGLIRIDRDSKPFPPAELSLPLPEGHPLRDQARLLRALGRRYQGAFAIPGPPDEG